MKVFKRVLKIKNAGVIAAFTLALVSIANAAIKTNTASFVDTSAYTSDFTAIPPFIETATGKPSVVLAFDVSGSMLVPAYPQSGVSWSGGVMTNFDPDKSYFGYFEDALKYSYDFTNEFFYEDAAGSWDGGFLNWLTMRRVDVARQVMIGGKVVDRAGVNVNGTTYYVLEGEREVRSSDDYRKSYASSSAVSPIPDNTTITIADAKIQASGLVGADTNRVALSDSLEIGYLDRQAWTTTDYSTPSSWPSVNFLNTYTSTPVVVALNVSFNGGDPSVARAYNVTSNSAQLGLVEWKSALDAHGAEDAIMYLVAEPGCHAITLDDGSFLQFCAGSETTTDVNDKGASNTVVFPRSFASNPAVFSGISSYENAEHKLFTQAHSRLGGTTVELMLTSGNTGLTSLSDPETMNWIAIEQPASGAATTGSGIDFEMGELTVTSSGTTANYSPAFSDKPIPVAASQTYVGTKPFSVRIGIEGEDDGGNGWSESQLLMTLQAYDDSAITSETSAYLSVKGLGAPKIRLALTTEPTGLVQENDAKVNFGLTVYNFDHRTDNLNNIVTGNDVHGGTMHPCYPIFNDTDRWNRRVTASATDAYSYVHTTTLYNGSTRDYICVPTSVHTPNNNIVQVIEDYPLIWGTTPIAESLLDVGRYVRQDSRGPVYTSVGGSSSNQRDYGNDPAPVFGLDGTSSASGYLWDPYYDAVQGQVLDCKKVFALNFNDGAPYRDYDGSSSTHPQPNVGNTNFDIYDIANDSHTENEALDNVALALRANDCRSDTGMGSHQEVISYFVYAALGADEQSNTSTRRMREAAARGGFVDEDSDNLPDPMHPSDAAGNRIDFNAYAALNSTPGQSNPTDCPPNEWDTNSDCEPDTFFLALDGAEIKDKLQAALNDILARVASGGAASVVTTTTNGEGSVFQSKFIPSKSDASGRTVRWYGDIDALMIDSDGLLRNDGDGDQTLDDYSVDQILDTCYDASARQVRVKLSTTVASRPNATQTDECNATVFNIDPLTSPLMKPLWRAQDGLSGLTDSQVLTQRASYTSNSDNRYIRTSLPNNAGTLVTQDFLPATFTSDKVGLLDTANTTDAASIVEFIRGKEITDGSMRNRTLDINGTDKVMRLGDIIYSTPVPVARPSERLNLLYKDDTYNTFAKTYRDRRTVLYVGGNDGMLHAFNAGWYDHQNQQFLGGKTGRDYWDLGQEIWAYVPYNALPHLKYLSDPDYGLKDGDHIYFVDQTPYVFDAKIFGTGGVTGQVDSSNSNASIHPGGWGTVLVVGFRSGGGTAEVYPDPTDLSTTATVRPSYLIFDITNPEYEPVLIGEFSHPMLGSTSSDPTALTVVQTGAGTDTDWFLMFGSGPSSTQNGVSQFASDQNAHLFLYNLKTQGLQNGFGTNGVMDLGATDAANSFVGGLTASDWDLDVTTNGVYFGTVQGLDTIENATNTAWPDANGDGQPDGSDGLYDDWSGKLFRVRVEAQSSATAHNWAVDVMYDVGEPVLNRPSLSLDNNLNRWVHVATGRYLTTGDSIDNDDGYFIGLKEPRQTNGSFTMEPGVTSISSGISALSGNVVDTTSATVVEGTGALNGSVSVPVTMASDNVQSLEEVMLKYSDASNYLNGWKKDLDETGYRGVRATGESLIFGGFFFQTTFAPDVESCSVTGSGVLHALKATTGTPWYTHVFGDPDNTTDQVDLVLDSVETGVSSSAGAAAHFGSAKDDGSGKVLASDSSTSLSNIEVDNLKGVTSKETSWREM